MVVFQGASNKYIPCIIYFLGTTCINYFGRHMYFNILNLVYKSIHYIFYLRLNITSMPQQSVKILQLSVKILQTTATNLLQAISILQIAENINQSASSILLQAISILQLAENINQPASSILLQAISILQLAVYIYQPASSILLQAISILQLAENINQPASSILLQAISILQLAVYIYQPAVSFLSVLKILSIMRYFQLMVKMLSSLLNTQQQSTKIFYWKMVTINLI